MDIPQKILLRPLHSTRLIGGAKSSATRTTRTRLLEQLGQMAVFLCCFPPFCSISFWRIDELQGRRSCRHAQWKPFPILGFHLLLLLRVDCLLFAAPSCLVPQQPQQRRQQRKWRESSVLRRMTRLRAGGLLSPSRRIDHGSRAVAAASALYVWSALPCSFFLFASRTEAARAARRRCLP